MYNNRYPLEVQPHRRESQVLESEQGHQVDSILHEAHPRRDQTQERTLECHDRNPVLFWRIVHIIITIQPMIVRIMELINLSYVLILA
eukprot:UN30569